jgi:hypothetical protein
MLETFQDKSLGVFSEIYKLVECYIKYEGTRIEVIMERISISYLDGRLNRYYKVDIRSRLI